MAKLLGLSMIPTVSYSKCALDSSPLAYAPEFNAWERTAGRQSSLSTGEKDESMHTGRN